MKTIILTGHWLNTFWHTDVNDVVQLYIWLKFDFFVDQFDFPFLFVVSENIHTPPPPTPTVGIGNTSWVVVLKDQNI